MASEDLSKIEVVECLETESYEEYTVSAEKEHQIKSVEVSTSDFIPNKDGSGTSDSDSQLCLKNMSA